MKRRDLLSGAVLLLTGAAALAQQPTPNGATAQKVPQKAVLIPSRAATRFSDSGGIVSDRETGLAWRKADNGRDVDWNGASRYCAGLAPGSWKLPTMSELGDIYDGLGVLATPCGQWSCKASPLFNLSGPRFWSSEASDSSLAWFTTLVTGDGGAMEVSKSENNRALCVRRGG